jgi:hypothetical protein
MDSIANPKVKTIEGERVRARSLTCYTSRVEERVEALGWNYDK